MIKFSTLKIKELSRERLLLEKTSKDVNAELRSSAWWRRISYIVCSRCLDSSRNREGKRSARKNDSFQDS